MVNFFGTLKYVFSLFHVILFLLFAKVSQSLLDFRVFACNLLGLLVCNLDYLDEESSAYICFVILSKVDIFSLNCAQMIISITRVISVNDTNR